MEARTVNVINMRQTYDEENEVQGKKTTKDRRHVKNLMSQHYIY